MSEYGDFSFGDSAKLSGITLVMIQLLNFTLNVIKCLGEATSGTGFVSKL